jgi:hypothetical protein
MSSVTLPEGKKVDLGDWARRHADEAYSEIKKLDREKAKSLADAQTIVVTNATR